MKKIINRTQRIGAYVLATAMAASLSVTAIAAQPAETAEAPAAQTLSQRAPGGMGFGRGQSGEMPQPNGERPAGKTGRGGYSQAIESVEDEATREKLTALQEKLAAAMQAERAAKDDDTADHDALREAVKEAREALEEALADAGVTVQRGARPGMNGEIPPEKPEGEAPAGEGETPPEKPADDSEPAKGLFGRWFGNLFGGAGSNA